MKSVKEKLTVVLTLVVMSANMLLAAPGGAAARTSDCEDFYVCNYECADLDGGGEVCKTVADWYFDDCESSWLNWSIGECTEYFQGHCEFESGSGGLGLWAKRDCTYSESGE